MNHLKDSFLGTCAQDYINYIKNILVSDRENFFGKHKNPGISIGDFLIESAQSFIFIFDEWDFCFNENFMSENDIMLYDPTRSGYIFDGWLEGNIIELEKLIKAINKTNSLTYIESESITDIIAKRDALGLKLSVLRSFIDTASEKIDRYSNKEIKILSTVNVSEKQEEVDKLSKEYRIIDTKLQGLNWTIDLVE